MTRQEFPTDRPAVVTCGLPYATGDLHAGHLRTYVAGDAYARALETLGQETAFVCGTDMHGTPIAVNAAQAGVPPEEYARDFHEQYAETFPQFNVEFDSYGHTHDETNAELTREFVRQWVEGDHVFEKEIEVAWDTEEDQPLPDRFVEGTCPYCGAQARGDECDEGCQRHLEPGEIEDPVSVITGNPAEYRTREHRFLRLSDFQGYLQEFIDRLEGTDNARNQPREWIEGELQDLCITRDIDWGIDYPEATEEDLVLYVWVDAPIEYVASTRQYSERVSEDEYDWRAVWQVEAREGTPPDPDPQEPPEGGEIVHVIGHDIIQHHTVFWPAMLRGAGYAEPRAVLACGFVNLDGQAFSTSRNRAVWAEDYLAEGFHPDLYRHHIVVGSAFEADVDFSWDGLRERVNTQLVGVLGNFCYRSLLFAYRNFGGTPEPEAGLSEEVEREIGDALSEFESAVREYEIRGLAEAPLDLARFGNEYIQRHEPWKLDEAAAASVIRDCVQVAKAVAVLMAPVLPGKAEALWTQLGEAGSVHDATLAAALEPPAAAFEEPAELFDKIEAERVERLNEELEARIAAATEGAEAEPGEPGTEVEAGAEGEVEAGTEAEAEVEAEPGAEAASADMDLDPVREERISFEDFQDLDLRVGEIVAADPVEGADDLARLEVDIGVETRQIVAGIKRLHDLSALPGERVVIVANLERAELFGIESNGMLLAAGEEADLLTTHGDAVPGTKIH
jgi:methionyl-tRNA synthetase